MYKKDDCLYYERWNRLKEIPGVRFVRTCDFAGVVEKDCVVVSTAGDFGVEYIDDDFFHWHIKTEGCLNKSFSSLDAGAKKWFATNLNTINERCEILPLGVYDESVIRLINQNLNNEKTNLSYCNFAEYSNVENRKKVKFQCKQAGIFEIEHGLSQESYYQKLSTFKFSVCPTGNGIDSYRIWECLYLNTFPIIQQSNFAKRILEFFPVLIVEDYSKLTKEFLESEHVRLSKIEYKDKLTYSYWSKKVKEAAKLLEIHE